MSEVLDKSAAPLRLRDSEMGARVLAFDWASTPLGPIDRWPLSLRTAVGICLNSRFPMFVWWGPQLINIYNDAYIPVLGLRHPDALGRPARTVWAEIWPAIGPQVDQVMLRGEATWNETVHLRMERNGFPEDAWFTWSYSPIHADPDAAPGQPPVAGLFCACTEDTPRVAAERDRDRLALANAQSIRELEAERENLRVLVDIAPAFMCVLRGPEHRFEIVNEHYRTLIGGRAAVGRTVREVLPEIDGQGYYELLDRVYKTGRPYAGVEERVRIAHGSEVQERYLNFVYTPLRGPSGDVSGVFVHGIDVTEMVDTRERVARAEERTRLALSAAELGAWNLDPDTKRLQTDRRFRMIFGVDPDHEITYEQAIEIIHPGDRQHVRDSVAASTRANNPVPYLVEHRVVHPDGSVRWVHVKGRARTKDGSPHGEVVGFDGTVADITSSKLAHENLLASKERLALATGAADLGLWTWSADDDGAVWENDRMFEIYGLDRTAKPLSSAQFIAEIIHPEDAPSYTAAINRAIAGERFYYVGRIRRADGAIRWVEFTGRLQPGHGAGPVRMAGTAADVTDRIEAEEALRLSKAGSERQRRLYEAILTNTPDFAYVFDLQHRVIYANEVLLRMWGRTREETIGRTFLEIGYEPWHAEMHVREIDTVAATKAPIRGEVPFNGTFGRRIYDYIFVPVIGESGEVEAVAGTTRDVTDRKLSEEERDALLASERAARAEAERAGRLKDEFLATLSHELRTPLNAVLGWAQILRKKPPSIPTLDQGLAVIERNARLQAQLIADLLDMSRIISGKMRLDIQRVELPVVIEAALEGVRPAAEAKGVKIENQFEGPNIGSIQADPARLQQIVWNLASNAVKFTPRAGRVTVSVSQVESHVEIAVGDTGKGINPAFVPHVFERFRQADASAAREHGGLGLGLAIVKQLVDLHGGSVRAASEGEGKGSTFTVTLPIAAVVPPRLQLSKDPGVSTLYAPDVRDHPDLAGIRMLVVEDEADSREMVKRLLEECNARVTVAASAEEAAAAANEAAPDVILSDIGLPGGDGYTLMRTLRSSGVTAPAIALTAFARTEDVAKALSAGFQAHLAKPIEPSELLAKVRELAQRQP